MTLDHLSDTAKQAVDVLSLGTLVATLFSLLPAATALLVLVWTAMRIYESWQSIKLNARKLRND